MRSPARDICAGFQAKLPCVLQEREFERVDGTRPVKADVRLTCATSRGLAKMVQRGEYRAGLHDRINVVSIFLPALRERRADIPPLVAHLIDRYNEENRRPLKTTPEAMKVLASCFGPGDVRKLENRIERKATPPGASREAQLADEPHRGAEDLSSVRVCPRAHCGPSRMWNSHPVITGKSHGTAIHVPAMSNSN